MEIKTPVELQMIARDWLLENELDKKAIVKKFDRLSKGIRENIKKYKKHDTDYYKNLHRSRMIERTGRLFEECLAAAVEYGFRLPDWTSGSDKDVVPDQAEPGHELGYMAEWTFKDSMEMFSNVLSQEIENPNCRSWTAEAIEKTTEEIVICLFHMCRHMAASLPEIANKFVQDKVEHRSRVKAEKAELATDLDDWEEQWA